MHSSFTIKHDFKSPNFIEEKNRKIKYIIIHHTVTPNIEGVSKIFMSKKRRVSSHYVIDKDGSIYKFVDEKNIARHAGVSAWECDRNLNPISLGIEIINEDGNIHKYPDIQIKSVLAVAKSVIKSYKVSPFYVLGHSDIAIDRKIDPGCLFPWKFCSEQGVGAYPTNEEIDSFKSKNKDFCNFVSKNILNIKKFLYDCVTSYGYRCPKRDSSEKIMLIFKEFNRHFNLNDFKTHPYDLSVNRSLTLFTLLEKKGLMKDLKSKVGY